MANNNIQGGFKLLRNPNISRMFVAYLITFTGTAMAPIAMAFGVLELTGSTEDAAIVIAAPTLAAIGVLLFGGILADRTSRQKVICGAELLAMLAQFSLAFLFLANFATVPWLTFFMLINGIAMALHAPAATGFIIQLVDKKDLQAANALLGTARNGAVAGGAALGGILVATFGAGVTLAIDAASFAIAAIIVASVNPKLQSKLKAESVFEDLRLGWKEFSSHTWLWVMTAQFSLIVAALEAVFGLIGPAVARDYMGGAVDWGFIASGFGLGTLVGGLVAMRVHPKYPMRFATLCVFFLSGVAITLAMRSPLHVVIAAAFVGGLAGQIFAVLWYTSMQTKIPAHMLSRVSAYDHLGSVGLAPLGLVAAGFMYETLGYQTTLIIAALTVIIPTLITFSVRDVRMMTTD